VQPGSSSQVPADAEAGGQGGQLPPLASSYSQLTRFEAVPSTQSCSLQVGGTSNGQGWHIEVAFRLLHGGQEAAAPGLLLLAQRPGGGLDTCLVTVLLLCRHPALPPCMFGASY